MKKIFSIIAAAAVVLTACNKPVTPPVVDINPTITFTPQELQFAAEPEVTSQTVAFKLDDRAEWEVTSPTGGWFTMTGAKFGTGSGSFTITVLPNDTYKSRSTTIDFKVTTPEVIKHNIFKISQEALPEPPAPESETIVLASWDNTVDAASKGWPLTGSNDMTFGGFGTACLIDSVGVNTIQAYLDDFEGRPNTGARGRFSTALKSDGFYYVVIGGDWVNDYWYFTVDASKAKDNSTITFDGYKFFSSGTAQVQYWLFEYSIDGGKTFTPALETQKTEAGTDYNIDNPIGKSFDINATFNLAKVPEDQKIYFRIKAVELKAGHGAAPTTGNTQIRQGVRVKATYLK